ncbi:IS5 family transposase [Oculatella sp. FACHB-28]|uniref:IS5 family transposase n=1 Tax=Oculatella sp. FACHB-28 TaxID=2692845 RepID=UPI001F554A55|nr:IS5 family transposase [Oculatella sp. FACHB-28]
MSQPVYNSDLTDPEWQQIEPLLPAAKPVGKGREVDLREVLNAIFYRADNGIKWRALPRDFPAWQTVYGYYRLWVRLGVWEQINLALVREVRLQEGRQAQPSLVIIDSQSVKLGTKRGEEQGVDGFKQVKGRKRHIVVDVLGLVLGCYVTAANIADVKAAPGVLVWVLQMYGRIVKILADKGYRGDLGALLTHFFAQAGRQVELEISQRPDKAKGFQLEPKRWIVERTWSWLDNARILTRDYERLPENHEGMIYIVMIRLMLRRLTNNQRTWKSKAT